jgi:hypothetical protein
MKGKVKVWYLYKYVRNERGKYIQEFVEDCLEYNHAVRRKNTLKANTGVTHYVSHRFDNIKI